MEGIPDQKLSKRIAYANLAWLSIGFFIALMTGFYAGKQSIDVAAQQALFADNSLFIPQPRTQSAGCVAQQSLPDPECTPGAIFPDITLEKVCVSGYTKTVRDVSASLKKQVYRSYTIPYPQPFGTFELDHYIPLVLGGSNDIANLWPFAADPRPGFIEKDLTVNYLRRKVCNGEITLAAAQRAITTPWVDVYMSIPESEKAELKRLYPSWAETKR